MFESGCRAGAFAPPVFRRNAAAHGWPPYAGRGVDSPEDGNPSGAFRRVVEDADPYEGRAHLRIHSDAAGRGPVPRRFTA